MSAAPVLLLTAGLTLSGITAMVASHPNAAAVSLKQWAGLGGRGAVREDDFAAAMAAVSWGSRNARRAVPVQVGVGWWVGQWGGLWLSRWMSVSRWAAQSVSGWDAQMGEILCVRRPSA